MPIRPLFLCPPSAMVAGMKRSILAGLLAGLAACSPAGNDPGPGGVTVDEAKALDEAAEMLEQRRLPDSSLSGDSQPDTAEGAEAPAPDQP